MDSEELNPDEVIRFESLLEVYFTFLEDADYQYKSDLYFDEDDDTDLVVFVAHAFREMLCSRWGGEWWDRVAQARCTPSFYAKIQQIRANWQVEGD